MFNILCEITHIYNAYNIYFSYIKVFYSQLQLLNNWKLRVMHER